MSKCAACERLIRKNATYCAYCGQKVYVSIDFDEIDDKVNIDSEEYTYKGENRTRLVVKRGRYDRERLFSFIPDFLGSVGDAWICDDYVWFISEYKKDYRAERQYHLRRIRMNGKKIDDFGEVKAKAGGVKLYKAENGFLYFVVTGEGMVYLYKGANELIAIDLQGAISYNGDFQVYNEQVFVYTRSSYEENLIYDEEEEENVIEEDVIYDDGVVTKVMDLIDYNDVVKKVDAYFFNTYCITSPNLCNKLNYFKPWFSCILLGRGDVFLKSNKDFFDYSIRVNIYTGIIKVGEDKINETERCTELISWNDIEKEFEELSKLLKEKALEEQYLGSFTEMNISINYVFEYDDESIIFSFNINATPHVGTYSKVTQKLGFVKATDYKLGMDILQSESVTFWESTINVISWNDVKEQFPELQELFSEKRFDAMVENSAVNLSAYVNFVLAYDCRSVTISFNIDGSPCVGIYNKETKRLGYVKATDYNIGMDILQSANVEYWQRNAGMHYLDSIKNNLLDKFTDILEPLRANISKHIQHNAFAKKDEKYVTYSYSMEKLKNSIHQVAGIEAEKNLFYNYPLKLNGEVITDEKVYGLWLIMNLSVIGYDKVMVVRCYNNSRVFVAENIQAFNRNEWFNKIKDNFKEVKAPYVVTTEELQKKVPTISNKEKEFEIRGGYLGYKRWHYDSLSILRQYNDEVYEKKDPNDYIYGHYDFYCKVDGLAVQHPILQNLKAYALCEKGVFYIVDGEDTIIFMAVDGICYKVTEQKNVLRLSYEQGKLIINEFERLQQTRCNEHRDTFMGLDEEWVDIYKVCTKDYSVDVRKFLNDIC